MLEYFNLSQNFLTGQNPPFFLEVWIDELEEFIMELFSFDFNMKKSFIFKKKKTPFGHMVEFTLKPIYIVEKHIL